MIPRPATQPRVLVRIQLLVSVLALSVTPLAAAQNAANTREVADRFRAATFEQRYDDLLDIYSDDAVFFDPTADVFPDPLAQGEVVGSEAIVAMQKSWGIAESTFDIDHDFALGEYAVARGTLNVRYTNSDARRAIPTVIILQVRNGRVIAHTDIGEYVQSFQLGTGFDANTRSTTSVADRYLAAYLGRDIAAQATLLAENAVFQDPTSAVFGPPSGLAYRGRDAIVERRKPVFENIREFDLDIEKSFYQNHHAVYMGVTRYTIQDGRRFAHPAVFVVEVRDGAVTRHWDYVDYSVNLVN